MSYDQAIEQWRGQSVDPPAFAHVERARRWSGDADLGTAGHLLRVRLYLWLAVSGFVAFATIDWLANISSGRLCSSRAFAVLLPVATLVASMVFSRRRNLGFQMLARAIWWSTLIIGLLISIWGLDAFRFAGVPIALGSGGALLLTGGRGLAIASRAFRPIAFRDQLLAALVMAFADAQTLLFSGIMLLEIGQPGWTITLALGNAWATLAAGAVMTACVWGIYRLRTWALLLNIVANVVIAALAMGGHLGLSLPVSAALASTATIQLLLPVPILAAALGDRNRDRKPLLGAGGMLARVVILGFMVFASIGVAFDGGFRVGWVPRTHYALYRGVVYHKPIDRSGEDLRGEVHLRWQQPYSDFEFARMDGIILDRARLNHAKMAGAVLDNASLKRVTFTGADLRGASLRDASARLASFRDANLLDAVLAGADLEIVALTGAELTGADLSNANLRGAVLVRATAAGANFTGADLTHAIVTPSILAGAVLRDVTCPTGVAARDNGGTCTGQWGTTEPELPLACFVGRWHDSAHCTKGKPLRHSHFDSFRVSMRGQFASHGEPAAGHLRIAGQPVVTLSKTEFLEPRSGHRFRFEVMDSQTVTLTEIGRTGRELRFVRESTGRPQAKSCDEIFARVVHD